MALTPRTGCGKDDVGSRAMQRRLTVYQGKLRRTLVVTKRRVVRVRLRPRATHSGGEWPARSPPSTAPQPTTRRRFLRRAGTVGGAIGIAAAPTVLATAIATDQGVLSPRRKSVYTSLVEVVGSVPGTLVDPSRAGQATRALAAHYQQASPHTREEIDSTLDAIDKRDAAGSFSQRAAGDRLTLLRAALDSDEGRRTEMAVALAAAPFQSGGFRWDPGAATLWVRVARSLNGAAV